MKSSCETTRGAGFFSTDVSVGTPFLILFLLFAVLGIYYPTIFGQLNSVDDRARVATLLNQDHFDFLRLFLHGRGHYYFRPLVASSFYLDRLLFSCRPEIMHFENVIIHSLNTLLVFLAARKLLQEDNKEYHNSISLMVALFFGLHPLCTEPVNWVSGRYDLLATLFVLLSFYVVIGNTNQFRWWKGILGAFFLLLGLLSKEVAAGFIIVFILGLVWPGSPFFVKECGNRLKHAVPIAGVFILYLWMRCGLQIGNDSGLVSAIKGAHDAAGLPYWLKLRNMITAFGFYAKKLVCPFPLNFAIYEINMVAYFLLGILSTGILIWIVLKKRRRIGFYLVWGAAFVLPALLVAVNHMAWTLLAERYLYTSLIGASLVAGILVYISIKRTRVLPVVMGGLLFVFAWQTAKRNIVWQKNITLFADVVAKSPAFASGHNEYGIALLQAGRTEEAKEQFALAASLSGKSPLRAMAAVNAAGFGSAVDVEKAINENLGASGLSRKNKIAFLKSLTRNLEKQLRETSDPQEKQTLLAKNIPLQRRLYRKTKDPFHLYREGQLHLALGEKAMAEECFKKVCKHSNAFYTNPACKLYQKLVEEQ